MYTPFYSFYQKKKTHLFIVNTNMYILKYAKYVYIDPRPTHPYEESKVYANMRIFYKSKKITKPNYNIG